MPAEDVYRIYRNVLKVMLKCIIAALSASHSNAPLLISCDDALPDNELLEEIVLRKKYMTGKIILLS
ncbi:hypothetical protein BTJ40_00550 [Microbulbifer sp. A4B17]|uniref:hypothetical protein n=1 Tax=Microbulbifer sp. A4B17 TaxID=359370 RepID=UPI000D52A85B|nr:hypothetical protein [Microbulbifer sp. A4B17]AWF79438.1 hypothetical protein BTJ40_00550 [Microbulbifer sp. A4B17]